MPIKYVDLRKQIIDSCLRLEELDFFVGTYGNVSVRIEEGLMVTPSRVDYRSMSAEDMVPVSLEGKVLGGDRLPSSELEVHRHIYLCRADVGAIVHGHSVHATTLSCVHASIPVIVEEQSQVVGGEIRCTCYVPAGRHGELGQEVARTLAQSNAVLVANHGSVSCGRTLEEAILTCRIVERVAQMYLFGSTVGTTVSIPNEFVISERDRWLYKYGTTADRTRET